MWRVGADCEGKGVVAAWCEWKRDLLLLFVEFFVVVVVEAHGGASGSGFEELVGTVELVF